MAMLLKDILERASALDGAMQNSIQFISAGGQPVILNECLIQPAGKLSSTDLFIVPPFNRSFEFDLSPFQNEIEMITHLPSTTLKISTCMGALLLAEAKALDHKKATTHWKARDFVTGAFPFVEWSLNQIVCDAGDVITSGGYLATIDMALYLVNKLHSSQVAHYLGSHLLVDSIRQKQSIYAVDLTRNQADSVFMQSVEQWIESNLHQEILIKTLASHFLMSERGFYRAFFKAFGLSPNKMIQLKRIEKAKTLLKNTSKSIDVILGEIGFVDVASFRRLFLREMGMTPHEYRRRITL